MRSRLPTMLAWVAKRLPQGQEQEQEQGQEQGQEQAQGQGVARTPPLTAGGGHMCSSSLATHMSTKPFPSLMLSWK